MTTKSKTPLYDELQQIFEFTQEDLIANRKGELSERQLERWKNPHHYYRSIRLQPAQILNLHFHNDDKAFVSKFASIILATFLIVFFISGELGFFLAMIGLLLFSALTIYIIASLILGTINPPFNPKSMLPLIKRDLRPKNVQSIKGQLHLINSNEDYFLRVGRSTFPLMIKQYTPLNTLKNHQPQQFYIFYYLRRSKVIVSAEPTSMDKSYWFER